jgi:hypothetical protein
MNATATAEKDTFIPVSESQMQQLRKNGNFTHFHGRNDGPVLEKGTAVSKGAWFNVKLIDKKWLSNGWELKYSHT